ncbi:MAG TPA: hypothetical protein VGM87_23910 [Roseomonas sp.]|jgi:hypothetical protein
MRGFARRNRSWFIPGSGANHHGALLSAIPILSALILGLGGPARAQDQQAQPTAAAPAAIQYVQRGIPAEASAENGVVARDRALASARRIAWDRLVGAAGTGPRSVSDSQLDSMVESIVIEQERTAPTRYIARVTVNFSRARTQGLLGGGGAAGGDQATASARPDAPSPAIASIVAVARYGGMAEWLELRRRLAGAPQVARVDVVAIATDRARLRLSLRAPAPAAAEQLVQAGIVLAPQTAAPQAGAPAADAWRVGLAGRS